MGSIHQPVFASSGGTGHILAAIVHAELAQK